MGAALYFYAQLRILRGLFGVLLPGEVEVEGYPNHPHEDIDVPLILCVRKLHQALIL